MDFAASMGDPPPMERRTVEVILLAWWAASPLVASVSLSLTPAAVMTFSVAASTSATGACWEMWAKVPGVSVAQEVLEALEEWGLGGDGVGCDYEDFGGCCGGEDVQEVVLHA